MMDMACSGDPDNTVCGVAGGADYTVSLTWRCLSYRWCVLSQCCNKIADIKFESPFPVWDLA